MAHALYQIYRPKTFGEVVGQAHVVHALSKAVETGTPSHAYVFAGGRGTGKTSLARIFARTLGLSDADIIEMDAASRTGVDDVREIIDSVSILPFSSQYKMYILDEAHMLSRSAFNALLKTLEEPPRHVIFVLATTDPEKLPDTVLSRCAVFSLEKPQTAAIETVLARAADGEGVDIDSDALSLIAILADGSFRDGLSILEQVIRSHAGAHIAREQVEHMTGAPKYVHIQEVLGAIAHKDGERIMRTIRMLEVEGAHPQLFVELLVRTVRAVLRARFGSGSAREQTESEHMTALVSSLLQAKEVNSKLLDMLISLLGEVKRSPMPYVLIEAKLTLAIAMGEGQANV